MEEQARRQYGDYNSEKCVGLYECEPDYLIKESER